MRVRVDGPRGQAFPVFAVLNNLLFVMGGYDGDGTSYATVEAYDPSSDSWTTKAPLPSGGAGGGCSAVNGKIYCAGRGSTGNQFVSFDPAANAWSLQPSAPVAPTALAEATSFNGVLYVIGDANNSGTNQAFTPSASALTSNAQNFNGTPIPGNSYLWFNSNFHLVSGSTPITVQFQNVSIQFTANATIYNLAVPDSVITFSSSATCASTTFVNGSWQTTVPTSGSDEIFLSGLAFLLPASGLPGGIKNVTWSGTVVTNAPGISLQWKWGAAAFSSFSNDYNSLGVKPTHQNACAYSNGDHAGTPENFKSVIGGGTGGGGSNFTGGWSGTVTVTAQ